MGQYIPVYLDNLKKNYKNYGLYEVIAFIGRNEYKGTKALEKEDVYELGIDVINSKLKKKHKKAIRRLVYATKKANTYNEVRSDDKPLWRIHRLKSEKVFDVIKHRLEKYKKNNCFEVQELLDSIISDLNVCTKAEAVGNPYYPVISNQYCLKANNYSYQDIKDLQKCARMIEKFDAI